MTIRQALGNTWGKIILVMLPLAVVASVALIRTHEKVTRLETTTELQVTRTELQGQLEAILRELAALREDVRDLRRVR